VNAYSPSLLFAVAAGSVLAAAGAFAKERALPQLHTHQSYIEEILRTSTVPIDDARAVFAFVLASLPERVQVYPTENYHYFKFLQNGTPYSGNIRIEIDESGKASLHFAYFETAADWHEETPGKHVVFGAAEGVSLEKLERLIYRVSYAGKSVTFVLNDLAAAKPPTGALGPAETFIGPVFDESGVRFFLVYNRERKVFLYVLDETTRLADELFPYSGTDRIVIGKRTGFAFYRDHRLARKILIGAYEGNVRLNNYFDGPFDQLPDNFVEGDTLRQAILEIQPSLRGKIDRFGDFPDGEERISIVPYLAYFELAELARFDRCASSKAQAADYYDCFVAEKLGFDVAEPMYKGEKTAGTPAAKRGR
jgi:hypothetical protein